MQQFLFSNGLSAEVKRRLDAFNEQQRTLNAWLEGIMVATAQANGAATTDVVRLNAEGTGVVVTSPPSPLSNREGEDAPPAEGVVVDEPASAKATAGKK